jgi:tripartite-type tricarboxylate transporter receptor subunit TctC
MACAQESADKFPSRPITLISPLAAGGPTDIEMRPYADEMSRLLGKPVVVDFKAGAGGSIAYSFLAKAPPDGYNLVFASDGLTISMALDKGLTYDPAKDFQPVTLMTQWTLLIVGSPHFPPRNGREYLAYAKANPGKVNWADAGPGSTNHMAGVWINGLAGANVTFIHYKGAAQYYADMEAGRADLTLTRLFGALPQVKAGRLIPLAVSSAQRSPLLPDVPTLQESGVPYVNSNWLGFIAPAGMQPGVLAKLSDALMKTARTPANVKRKIEQGGMAVGNTPEEFRQHILIEAEKWREVVAKYNPIKE